MSEPWAVVLTALEATAEAREGVARELRRLEDLRPRTVLLATCHRVEMYGFGPRPAAAAPMVCGPEAVRRLLRVAAGLESTSLGEDEVLHQVRLALARARDHGLREHRLQRLFETAIATGRRARAGGRARSRSLERRAAEWLAGQGEVRTVLVVGAGHMGRALAAEAARLGAQTTVATRRPSGGQLGLAEASARASRFDGVLVALAGPWAVDPGGLPPIADLSSPGALPAAVRAALGARHLGIDDLFAAREDDPDYAGRARAAVERSAGEYMAWLGARDTVTA